MGGTEPGSGDEEQEPAFAALEADDPAQLGGYHLVARLGAGGMGKVYLAYTLAGRPVAIKAIRPELADNPEFRRRFRREVAAAQRVHGLYTAPVIDSDTEGSTPWLATAFVSGPTLTAAVSEHGPLPVSAVLLLAAGVAEALQAVHGEGIVHGDLKASNVLLATDGPRVIDFGISRSAEATGFTTLPTGVVAGTPSFMSPEQAMNGEIGPATDVFSLGQLVAYAARGVPAFGEGQAFGLLYRTVYEEPELTGVPEALLPLLHRCLAKEPGERPSLAEVIDLCRAASDDGMLRRSGNWLPEAIAAEIARRQNAAPASTEHVPAEGEARDVHAEAHPVSSASAPPPPGSPGDVDSRSGTPQEASTQRRKPPRARRKMLAALSTALGAVLIAAAVLTVTDRSTDTEDGASGKQPGQGGATKSSQPASPSPSRTSGSTPSGSVGGTPTEGEGAGPTRSTAPAESETGEPEPSRSGDDGATGGPEFVDSSLRLADHFDLCIDVKGNQRIEGSAVQLWSCNTTSGQRWTMRADGTVRAYGDMCMNIAGPVEEDQRIELGRCAAGQGQKWEYTARKELRVKGETNPGLCLDDPAGSLEKPTRLKLFRCLGGVFSQQWYIFNK